MLYVLVGRKGMGKTIFCTRKAVNSERDVWANLRLYLDGNRFKPLGVSDLMNLPNSVMCVIDEAYTWFESRISGSVLNRYISYVIYQLRKKGYTDLFLTAQRFSTLDYRIRVEADVIIKCERQNNGVRPEDILPNGKDENGNRVPYYHFWDFKYTFFDVVLNEGVSLGNRIKTTKAIFPYDKMKEYFKYYNTNEVIDPAYKESMEYDLLKDNPSKLFEKAKGIADDISSILNEITHDTISLALMKKGYSPKYHKVVFNILKGKIEV
ncbi:MAG: hypothetical protein GF317_03570 [Candidatus Lokiarchaeota archaeon]|nr:hypothetical protein [Candidatus Lokiarchaeota archaeon]